MAALNVRPAGGPTRMMAPSSQRRGTGVAGVVPARASSCTACQWWPAPSRSHQGSSACGPTTRRAARCVPRALDPQQQHSSTAYVPLQWHDHDYHRVTFVSAPYGPMKLVEDSTFNGVLAFKRESDPHTTSSTEELNSEVLEVYIAGDTAFNTWSMLTHQVTDRPMVHELMWNLVERARSGDARNWGLLRAAIVELRENVFIGRLFFGDRDTGEVTWDCDCRPSDGIFLSLKAQSPFYVHRRVWDQAALPLRASSVFKIVDAQHAAANSNSSAAAAGSSQASSPASSTNATHTTGTSSSSASPSPSPFTAGYQEAPSGGGGAQHYRMGSPGGGSAAEEDEAPPAHWGGKPLDATATPDTLTMADISFIRPDDPEAIKLLKRKLTLAVREENYPLAARLRDHPWMHAYKEMHALRLRGRYEEAHQVEASLQARIDEADSSAQ